MFTKSIELPTIFFKDCESTRFCDYNKAFVLVQNIIYYKLTKDERYKLTESLIEKYSLKSFPPTRLTRIFPEKIGQLLREIVSKSPAETVCSFLKMIGIQLTESKVELTLL